MPRKGLNVKINPDRFYHYFFDTSFKPIYVNPNVYLNFEGKRDIDISVTSYYMDYINFNNAITALLHYGRNYPLIKRSFFYSLFFSNSDNTAHNDFPSTTAQNTSTILTNIFKWCKTQDENSDIKEFYVFQLLFLAYLVEVIRYAKNSQMSLNKYIDNKRIYGKFLLYETEEVCENFLTNKKKEDILLKNVKENDLSYPVYSKAERLFFTYFVENTFMYSEIHEL